MKNQFVTYEISKLLKELGFNGKCFGFYTEHKILKIYSYQITVSSYIKAPVWIEVIDWIYDNYKLIISIDKKDEKTINMGRWEVREYNILEALKYIKRDLFQRDL